MNRYGELLKDPRWQKKRLEIMNRDNWTCQLCGNTNNTLNVHHMWYDRYPWDVPSSLLITLCEACHEKEERITAIKLHEVFKSFSGNGILKMDMMELCISAIELPGNDHRAKVLKAIQVIKEFKNG